MSYRGHIKGGVVVFDSPTLLPDGTAVVVSPVEVPLDIEGQPIDPAFLIGNLAVDIGIPDLAVNHDHYLYGHPRVQEEPDDPVVRMARLTRAHLSLEGLSIGDSFGQGFFTHPDVTDRSIRERVEPGPSWPYTDDTLMTLSVFEALRITGGIDPDRLAASFADRYEGSRGYGPSMHRLLARIREGEHWRVAAREQFGGQGSFGNGAAMRAAPIGAYFADHLGLAVEHAAISAEVTHAHEEGIAGAVATAAAAAWAWRLRDAVPVPGVAGFLDLILPHVPDSLVADKIRLARGLDNDASVRLGVAALGNGTGLSAQDTVPFALWSAGRHLADFREALWKTVEGLGDRDTTCAIVGGIVAAFVGDGGIPRSWKVAREPLPDWPFQDGG